jgi:hypothetical protein
MMNNFSWDLFVMNQNTNMAGGWELKNHDLFFGHNSWTVALRQMKFGQQKIMDAPTTFIKRIVLSNEAFEYFDDVQCWGYVETNDERLCRMWSI